MRRKLLIGAVALAAACAGAATPALAAVPGLTRVVQTYALDPSLGEYKRASCPEGTRLLSAGYEVIGGGGDTRLYGIGVSSPPVSAWVIVTADADGANPWSAYGGGWGLRVILVCADPLPGHRMTYEAGPWPGDSTPLKTTAARCPEGTSVYGVGGGVHWVPTTRSLVIDENWTPNASLTAASVTAQEDENGTPDNWRTWAEVICAEPVPGLERVAATSVGGSASSKSVTANCPAGKRVAGAGGDIRRGHGEVAMTAVAPTPDLTGVRVTAHEDDTGTDARWYAVAYAICA